MPLNPEVQLAHQAPEGGCREAPGDEGAAGGPEVHARAVQRAAPRQPRHHHQGRRREANVGQLRCRRLHSAGQSEGK